MSSAVGLTLTDFEKLLNQSYAGGQKESLYAQLVLFEHETRLKEEEVETLVEYAVRDSGNDKLRQQTEYRIRRRVLASETVVDRIQATTGLRFFYQSYQNHPSGLILRYACGQAAQEEPCCFGTLKITFPKTHSTQALPSKRIEHLTSGTRQSPRRTRVETNGSTSASQNLPIIARVRMTHLKPHKLYPTYRKMKQRRDLVLDRVGRSMRRLSKEYRDVESGSLQNLELFWERLQRAEVDD